MATNAMRINCIGYIRISGAVVGRHIDTASFTDTDTERHRPSSKIENAVESTVQCWVLQTPSVRHETDPLNY